MTVRPRSLETRLHQTWGRSPPPTFPGRFIDRFSAFFDRGRELDFDDFDASAWDVLVVDARLTISVGEPLLADGVVIAVSADLAARILSAIGPTAASELRSIGYSSTVVVTFRYSGLGRARPPAWIWLSGPAG